MQMTSKIPRAMPLESKKTGHKPEPKDAAALNTRASVFQKTDGRPQKENIPRKNVAPKANIGISTRYGQQTELKEQNQNLIAANDELQKNLTETQKRVTELEQQYSDLEREKTDVQKHLTDCHVLLVAANIDPVLGETVGEAVRENQEQRKEVMTVSTELLKELKTFADVTSEQHGRLQRLQSTFSELTKAHEQMIQEREKFALEAADLENALNEAEALLL